MNSSSSSASANRSPAGADSDLRKLIRTTTPRLAALTLEDAVVRIAGFYRDVRDYAVEEGCDGLVFYSDLTRPGVKLEIGACRLFRLPSEERLKPRPAYRLRLSLQYKIDVDVAREAMTDGTWSFYCWSRDGLDQLLASVRATCAFKAMANRNAWAVRIRLEQATYKLFQLHPAASMRQTWWGVSGVYENVPFVPAPER